MDMRMSGLKVSLLIISVILLSILVPSCKGVAEEPVYAAEMGNNIASPESLTTVVDSVVTMQNLRSGCFRVVTQKIKTPNGYISDIYMFT